MNRPDDQFDDLEQRLRSHYQQRADELHLTRRDWVDPTVRVAGRRPATMWLVAASVTALVVGAAAGSAVLLRFRGADDSGVVAAPTGSAPTDSLAQPVPLVTAPDVPPGNTAPCPESAGSPEPPPEGWPNDFRSPGMLLPARLDGYCVIDHTVVDALGGLSIGPEYTVWTDCGACDSPSAAVALVVGASATDEWDSTLSPETVSVGEREGQYYPPGDAWPRFRLYTVDTTGDPVVFTGWGLDRDAAIVALEEILQPETDGRSTGSAPDALVDDAESAANETSATPERGEPLSSGLQEVYSGAVGPYSASEVPFAAEFWVGYWAESGGENLAYGVQRFSGELGPIVTPPAAWLFSVPGAHLATIDGQTVAVLGPSDGFNGQRTQVVMVLDDHTAVTWIHDAPEPMTEVDLAAIELSPADVTDPRWLEIADESGMYNAVG